MLAAVLASDYSRRASLSGEHDTSDAVATGLNLVSEELETSAGLAHTVLLGMADAVIAVDLAGLVTNANESAGSLLDRPSSELVNLPLTALFDSSISALLSQELLDTLPAPRRARARAGEGRPEGPERALQIMDALLHGIERFSAREAILVDVEVAAALLRAVRAAALVGARVVLAGIRPDVARTLVALEIDLTGVVAAGTLQSGIELALGTRRR